jgi:hypothetical protein
MQELNVSPSMWWTSTTCTMPFLGYLCLNVPALLGVISVHGSLKDAGNMERGFAPIHRNINCLQEEGEGRKDTTKSKANIISRPAIEPKCETKRVPLDPRIPDKAKMISRDLSPDEGIELLSFLDKNSDVFAWKTSDLTRVSRGIIEQKH